jgi:hypothetical protein
MYIMTADNTLLLLAKLEVLSLLQHIWNPVRRKEVARKLCEPNLLAVKMTTVTQPNHWAVYPKWSYPMLLPLSPPPPPQASCLSMPFKLLVFLSLSFSRPETVFKVKHVRDPKPELTITSFYVDSRNRLQHVYHGQPYARVDFNPQSGTKILASARF